jgi:hypothetical protein
MGPRGKAVIRPGSRLTVGQLASSRGRPISPYHPISRPPNWENVPSLTHDQQFASPGLTLHSQLYSGCQWHDPISFDVCFSQLALRARESFGTPAMPSAHNDWSCRGGTRRLEEIGECRFPKAATLPWYKISCSIRVVECLCSHHHHQQHHQSSDPLNSSLESQSS